MTPDPDRHGPQLSLVVSTIGRPDSLGRLARSLATQSLADQIELVVVDQDPELACTKMLRSRTWPFTVTAARSDRGLSLGRNVGSRAASAPLISFPDDDCWYRPDTVERALGYLAEHTGIAGVSGIQLTESGAPSMVRWPTRPTKITRRNFYRTAISSTMFMRTEWVRRVGGFDETLGAGSGSGYLSGEESDLILRMLAEGASWMYEPRIVVLQSDPRTDIDAGFVSKMAGYSRGFGRIFRQHHLSRGLFAALLLRKSAAAGVRWTSGQRELAAADRAFVRGALAGFRDAGQLPAG